MHLRLEINLKILVALLMAVALVGASNKATADTFFTYDYGPNVQGWEIGWNETSNYCMAHGHFNGGTDVLMGLESEQQGVLLFANPAWDFVEKDKAYYLSFLFDGKRSWSGAWLGLRIGNIPAFFKEVQIEVLQDVAHSNTLVLFVGKDKPQYLEKLSLKGTRAALLTAIDCTIKLPPRKEAADQRPRNEAADQSDAEGQRVATRRRQQQPESGPSSGTGIIISHSGHILTNYHVIKGCSSLSVTQIGNTPKPAEIIREDEINDLAIIKTNETYSDVAIFRIGASVKPGETVAVYGYPYAGAISLSGNIVSGNVTALSGLRDDVRFLQISAPVQPGNSGGPLLDESGLLIGVVSSQMNQLAVAKVTGSLPQNVNFAVRASVARDLLEAHNIPFETSSEASPEELTKIAEDARKFTVLITCP